MRRFERTVEPGTAYQDTLTLPFLLRQKSRLRVHLDGGDEAALLLPRGKMLRGGDLLQADDGMVVLVQAADEQVSTASAASAELLTRAAYHLGNRHVPVQVGRGWLRYQHDHVLDDMVRSLGLSLCVEDAPFEPEGGAYGGGHSHAHAHSHAHPHSDSDSVSDSESVSDPESVSDSDSVPGSEPVSDPFPDPDSHAHAHAHPHPHASRVGRRLFFKGRLR